jgi:hypothetical protein
MHQTIPNLCIPRVLNTMDENQVRIAFESLNFGQIDKVIIIRKQNEKFNIAFIYYRKWYDTENATRALNRLTNGQDLKIMYDAPWFWKAAKTVSREKRVYS